MFCCIMGFSFRVLCAKKEKAGMAFAIPAFVPVTSILHEMNGDLTVAGHLFQFQQEFCLRGTFCERIVYRNGLAGGIDKTADLSVVCQVHRHSHAHMILAV